MASLTSSSQCEWIYYYFNMKQFFTVLTFLCRMTQYVVPNPFHKITYILQYLFNQTKDSIREIKNKIQKKNVKKSL